jgi:hypothetical protein
MRGHILVSNEDGRRCVYVPAAHIQFNVTKGRQDRWIVCAFRTDGYHGRTREEAIPTTEHLKRAYQSTAEVEVPDHIVAFAVESERRRQESVGGFEGILTRAVAGKDKAGGFKELMAQLAREKLDKEFSEEAEDKIGEEIDRLITEAGGLQ